MRELRLGDDIDDYCIKCKRISNHCILAFMDRDPAKVRCRACYHEHVFLNEIAPPKKVSAKKAAKTAAKKAVAQPGE